MYYYSTTPLLLNFLFKSFIEERARLVGKIQKEYILSGLKLSRHLFLNTKCHFQVHFSSFFLHRH